MKVFYAICCILGIVLPYSQLLPWLMEHGLSVSLLFQETAQLRISAFAWLDVVISALTLFGFIAVEGTRLGMRYLWLPIVATCLVGVSLGFPLFLLLRQVHLEKSPKP